MESHAMSQARTRVQGDLSVNNVLNCTLARDALLTTKTCSTEESEASYNWALHLNTVQGKIHQWPVNGAGQLQHNFNMEVSKILKCHIKSSHDTVWRDHFKSLIV